MKIVFVGAGNLATNLALAFHHKTSHSIVQIFSRTELSANTLANRVEAEPITDINNIATDADIYIFSVKDDALSTLLIDMEPNDGLWLHTAGSISLDVFKQTSQARYGVLYPFQTFSKNRILDFENIPIFVEASNKDDLLLLKIVCQQLSPEIYELNSHKRQYLHLTGVLACNFVNHLYVLSNNILEENGIPFDILKPLIDEQLPKFMK